MREHKFYIGAPLKLLTFSLALLLSVNPGITEVRAAEGGSLDSLILDQMEQRQIPGLAAAAVFSGEVIWTGVYGFGNVENQSPVTEDTLFSIASVSKPITATVLLSSNSEYAWLDHDINTYLPFEVRNPYFPDVPITIRQLLQHRSSIVDNLDYLGPFWRIADGDPTVSLNDFLESYLVEGRENYSPEKNFLDEAPNTSKRYCNTCYALLGFITESVAEEPFEIVSKRLLFDPLGMTDTAWFLRDLQGQDIAMPYRYDENDGFIAYGHNGYPDWPAGQLRTSIRDISTFLAAYSNGGMSSSGRVIDQNLIDILSPENPELGFHTWFQRGFSSGQIVYQHGGGDIGVRSYMAFDPSELKGVVVLSNGEGDLALVAETVYEAIDTLLESFIQ